MPAWQEFVDAHAVEGRQFRGIGEPIWAERSVAELAECQRHESLLNLAFSGAPAWWLLCPYDTKALDTLVIDEARRSHPWVLNGAGHERSHHYRGLEASATSEVPLEPAGGDTVDIAFDPRGLGTVRRFTMQHATEAGLTDVQVADLVLVVNEIATNSLRHGGGSGILRIWQEEDSVIAEVSASRSSDGSSPRCSVRTVAACGSRTSSATWSSSARHPRAPSCACTCGAPEPASPQTGVEMPTPPRVVAP
jgi:hypothetical protein